MKRFLTKVALVVLVAGVSTVVAQDRVASAPKGANSGKVSRGQAAIDQAAATNKHAFVFFWKEKDARTQNARDAVQTAVKKWANTATFVEIQATDPAEKPLVDRYQVGRSPMPIVLAVAPCGAITKACVGTFDENQLREAFVSPCTAACMKALQAGKLVLLCVQPRSPQVQQASLQKGVTDFAADPQYVDHSKVIRLIASDPAEAAFLKDLRVDPQTPTPVTVLLAPPAAVVGTFADDVTKEELIAKVKEAQSSCGPNCSCHH